VAPRRTPRKQPESSRDAYHHGNLREELVNVAIEMIESSGVSGFSMAEACRRLNVTVAAPYRHFADRDALLTAVAIRACETLTNILQTAAQSETDPIEQLTMLARGYVEFAAQYPALFDTMYAKEIFMPGNIELADAVRPVIESFVLPARELEGDSVQVTLRLVVGVVAVAHGYAAFLRNGSFAGSVDSLRAAADNAMLAARALIAGRDELRATRAAPEMSAAGWTGDHWVEAAAGALAEAIR
jgi:AcrR family transcriptional regulator